MKLMFTVLMFVLTLSACGISQNSDLSGWSSWKDKKHDKTEYVVTTNDDLVTQSKFRDKKHSETYTSSKSFVDACSKCCTHILHDNDNADGFDCNYREDNQAKQCYKLNGVKNGKTCF